MAVELELIGLDESRAELAKLPELLRGEGRKILIGAGNRAAFALRSAYPYRTGNLRRGVELDSRDHGAMGIQIRIRNRARHVHIFEAGSKPRFVKAGRRRGRGQMPVGNVFKPEMIRQRARMYQELKALLARAGLRVSGDAAA